MHRHMYLVRFPDGTTAILRATVVDGVLTMPEVLNLQTGRWDQPNFIAQFEYVTEIDPNQNTPVRPLALASGNHSMAVVEARQPTPAEYFLAALTGITPDYVAA